jgi:hypothetical protein
VTIISAWGSESSQQCSRQEFFLVFVFWAAMIGSGHSRQTASKRTYIVPSLPLCLPQTKPYLELFMLLRYRMTPSPETNLFVLVGIHPSFTFL